MATRFLNLFCSRCNAHIALYKKKGTGNLLRLYLNMISGPETLAGLKQITNKSELPPLTCPQCGNLVGVPQKSGNRLAFRLIKGSFRKKKSD